MLPDTGRISMPSGEPSSSTTGNQPSAVMVIREVVLPHVRKRRDGIEHHRRAPVHVVDRALVPGEVFGDLHVDGLARQGGAWDDVAAAGRLCPTGFSTSPASGQSYGMGFTLQAALCGPAVC